MAWVAAAVTVGGIVYGEVKANNAKKDEKAALSQVKPYKTPKEVYDVLNATQYNAQSGFDASTLNYLTNQSDNAFAGSLGTAERLGADPNALSAIFNQKINGIMQVSAENHQLQTQNFSAYINALNAVGANSAAEQKSQQDLLKNELQRIANEKAIATQQISSSLSTGIAAYSNAQMAKLYGTNNAIDNTYIPQTTNTTGYLPNTVGSQTLKQTGLTIPQ